MQYRILGLQCYATTHMRIPQVQGHMLGFKWYPRKNIRISVVCSRACQDFNATQKRIVGSLSGTQYSILGFQQYALEKTKNSVQRSIENLEFNGKQYNTYWDSSLMQQNIIHIKISIVCKNAYQDLLCHFHIKICCSELCAHDACGHEPAMPAFNTDAPHKMGRQ